MKVMLTLTIEKETIERAKLLARRQGSSVSQIVVAYLESVADREQDPISGLGKSPVNTGQSHAAEEHDHYLYTSNK